MYDEPPIPEEAPSEPTRLTTRLVPWVLMLGVALLFFPLTLISTAIDETNVLQATQSADLQATITAPPPVPRDEQTLTQQLLDQRVDLGAIEPIPATMIASHVDLPAIMAALRSYNANRIRLTAFNHPTNRLTLDGAAMEERDVLTYISALEATGLFTRVSLQSITVNPVAPATPDFQATPDKNAPLTELYLPFIFTLSIDLPGKS